MGCLKPEMVVWSLGIRRLPTAIEGSKKTTGVLKPDDNAEQNYFIIANTATNDNFKVLIGAI